MKKILFLFLTAILFFSCSQENELSNEDNTSALTEASSAMESQRQMLLDSDTYIGIYKGVFTTNNSEYRATAEIIIPEYAISTPNTIDRPTASLNLINGDIYSVTAQAQVSEEVNVNKYVFSSNDLSFIFSVNLDGTNAQISNVIFKQLDASIIVLKNTNRAPITPITGTYVCTQCQNHPILNNSLQQTWNVVIDENSGVITSQIALGIGVYNGIGQRSNCIPTGNITSCDIVGSTSANGEAINWTGSYQYSNLPPNPATDCSEMQGNWTYATAQYGNIVGTFISDTTCNLPPPIILLYNNFQTFTGAGFSPGALPASGRLDSNIYRASGLNPITMNFGDTKTTGNFARGLSSGNVSTTGIYAFQTGGGNVAWGIQSGSSFFIPGFFGIKVPNNTGNTLNLITVSYDIYVNNDQNRANSGNFSYSTDGVTFIDVPALDYISPGPADNNGWIMVSRTTTISTPLANGSFIYVRFNGNDVSGSGDRDEFGLDNLMVKGL